MRFDNGPADLQPHSYALKLGGKESIENLFRLLQLQSHAGIANGDYELSVVFIVRLLDRAYQ